jgi:uncharacterized protein YbjT (DUF2867 family)
MKTMNILITGATGMVGRGVLEVALEDERISKVIVLNRHTVGLQHPKLKEILTKNFYDITPLSDELKNIDACFFCLGVSAAGMTEEEYNHLTYDLTISFARHLKELNPAMTFIYVSGAGTDSTEKGRMMWARVKGKTENALLALNFRQAFMFRPGIIIPMRGIKSRTKLYNMAYVVLRPFFPLLKRSKTMATDTDRLGKAMVNAAANGYSKKIIEMADIFELSK